MYPRRQQGCNCPCKYDPIVLPVREKECHRYFYVEQPVICPTNTQIVNHYVPRPVYYPSHTVTEKTVCDGGNTAAGTYNGTYNDCGCNK